MLIRQAYRFKLREKSSQAALLRRFAGCRRFVWNTALAEQRARHERGESYASYVEMAKWLTVWRNAPDTSFLRDAPIHALQEALKSLDAAYRRFLQKQRGHPRFKRRSDFEGFRELDPACFSVDAANQRIRLPKVGWVRFRLSREILGAPRNISVTRELDGWYVSIQTERDDAPLLTGRTEIGLDRGVTNFYATSDGTLKAPINAHRSLATRLKRYQRVVSRRMEAAKRVAGLPANRPFPKGFRLQKSNRLKRAENKVQRLHQTIRRVRGDFLHCESTRLANTHRLIAIEDLKIRSMTAAGLYKRGLNRTILDQGWGEFAQQLDYKLGWRNGQLIKVNPAYTSQTCSACNHVAAKSRNGERFQCVACGHVDHADINAAKNILAVGHTVLARQCVAQGHADVEGMVNQGRPMKRQPAQAEVTPCLPLQLGIL